MLRTLGKWNAIFIMAVVIFVVGLLFVTWIIWPGHAWVYATGSPWWVSIRNMFTPTTTISQGFGGSISGNDFEIGSCDPFSNRTGAPLNEAASTEQGQCSYSAPASSEPPAEKPKAEVPASLPAVGSTSSQVGHTIPTNTNWIVPAGWRCSGDLDILTAQGEWYSPYIHEDDSENTGMLSHFSVQTRVNAPSGAYCDPDDTWETMKIRMRQDGCNSGCTDFNPVNWPE